jgi:putative ABC transport system ATP-binding protein
MPRGPVIRLEGVGRTFDGASSPAVADVTFDVQPGEMVALIGPSGAGKTTLFGMLACLDRPTVGRYELLGVDAGIANEKERASLRNRRIGLLFGEPRMAPHLSLQHNVELPLEYGAGKRYRVRARDALARVGLEALHRARPGDVGPAERRLAAVARALIMNPHVLLADEPVGGLDAVAGLRVLAHLQRQNIERGLTMFIATQAAEVAVLCSRVIAIEGGRVVADERVPGRRLATSSLAAALGKGSAFASAGSETNQ